METTGLKKAELNTNSAIVRYKEGFNAGFMQLRQMDVATAREELWKALGINNRESFRYYLTGKIEPRASQAVAIELVFAKYGITENIWGKGK